MEFTKNPRAMSLFDPNQGDSNSIECEVTDYASKVVHTAKEE